MNKTTDTRTDFLRIIWPLQAGRAFVSDAGETVEVVGVGEYDAQCDRFEAAEVVVNGTVFRGEVILGDPDTSAFKAESCVLHVVPSGGATHIVKADGSFLTQIVLAAGPVTDAAFGVLREGAGKAGCAKHVRGMEPHERVSMFTRLLADRLRRKCNDVKEIFESCEQSWSETMYIMLLRTMGDHRNKEAFTELARRVRYSYVSRERNSLEHVEALLLGTSGLLDLYEDDSYTRTLKAHFEYLRNKYTITAMMPGAWTMSQTKPHNHPVLRIAQLAAFLSTQEFLFDNLVKCRTVEGVHSLFRAEASQYWSTHFTPSRATESRPKRIGHFKANILGINLAVPMIFSYGDYMSDEGMKDAALELLERINCEENTIIDGWRSGGVAMESAFDSQAVLQLNNEYCLKGMCAGCPVGRRVIRRVYTQEHA